MLTKTYEIDRIAASKLLKVSTRTVDRYLNQGHLSARKIRGRVLLCRQEIADLKKGLPYENEPGEENNRSLPVQITKNEQRDVIKPHPHDLQLYKDLYEEAMKAAEEKEKKLEQAQYRIGQLESHSSSHVPMKTFSSDMNESQIVQMLRQNIAESEKNREQLQQQLKRDRFNRRIISAILYVILVLQPVMWYLLRNAQNF